MRGGLTEFIILLASNFNNFPLACKVRPPFPKAALHFQSDFYLPAVAHGLAFNPVGAAGVGAGVGWFGLAWLAGASIIVRAF